MASAHAMLTSTPLEPIPKNLPLEARHTLSLELSRRRRLSVPSSIFLPKDILKNERRIRSARIFNKSIAVKQLKAKRAASLFFNKTNLASPIPKKQYKKRTPALSKIKKERKPYQKKKLGERRKKELTEIYPITKPLISNDRIRSVVENLRISKEGDLLNPNMNGDDHPTPKNEQPKVEDTSIECAFLQPKYYVENTENELLQPCNIKAEMPDIITEDTVPFTPELPSNVRRISPELRDFSSVTRADNFIITVDPSGVNVNINYAESAEQINNHKLQKEEASELPIPYFSIPNAKKLCEDNKMQNIEENYNKDLAGISPNTSMSHARPEAHHHFQMIPLNDSTATDVNMASHDSTSKHFRPIQNSPAGISSNTSVSHARPDVNHHFQIIPPYDSTATDVDMASHPDTSKLRTILNAPTGISSNTCVSHASPDVNHHFQIMPPNNCNATDVDMAAHTNPSNHLRPIQNVPLANSCRGIQNTTEVIQPLTLRLEPDITQAANSNINQSTNQNEVRNVCKKGPGKSKRNGQMATLKPINLSRRMPISVFAENFEYPIYTPQIHQQLGTAPYVPSTSHRMSTAPVSSFCDLNDRASYLTSSNNNDDRCTTTQSNANDVSCSNSMPSTNNAHLSFSKYLRTTSKSAHQSTCRHLASQNNIANLATANYLPPSSNNVYLSSSDYVSPQNTTTRLSTSTDVPPSNSQANLSESNYLPSSSHAPPSTTNAQPATSSHLPSSKNKNKAHKSTCKHLRPKKNLYHPTSNSLPTHNIPPAKNNADPPTSSNLLPPTNKVLPFTISHAPPLTNNAQLSISNYLPPPNNNAVLSTSSQEQVPTAPNYLPSSNIALLSTASHVPDPANNADLSRFRPVPPSANNGHASAFNYLPSSNNFALLSTSSHAPNSTKKANLCTSRPVPPSTNNDHPSTSNCLPSSNNNAALSTSSEIAHPTSIYHPSSSNYLPSSNNIALHSTASHVPAPANSENLFRFRSVPPSTNNGHLSNSNYLAPTNNNDHVSASINAPSPINNPHPSTSNYLPPPNNNVHQAASNFSTAPHNNAVLLPTSIQLPPPTNNALMSTSSYPPPPNNNIHVPIPRRLSPQNYNGHPSSSNYPTHTSNNAQLGTSRSTPAELMHYLAQQSNTNLSSSSTQESTMVKTLLDISSFLPQGNNYNYIRGNDNNESRINYTILDGITIASILLRLGYSTYDAQRLAQHVDLHENYSTLRYIYPSYLWNYSLPPSLWYAPTGLTNDAGSVPLVEQYQALQSLPAYLSDVPSEAARMPMLPSARPTEFNTALSGFHTHLLQENLQSTSRQLPTGIWSIVTSEPPHPQSSLQVLPSQPQPQPQPQIHMQQQQSQQQILLNGYLYNADGTASSYTATNP